MAQSHLRGVLCFCNVALFNGVEAYLQFKPDLIDDQGNVSNPDTEAFLRKYIEAFAAFVKQQLAARATA